MNIIETSITALAQDDFMLYFHILKNFKKKGMHCEKIAQINSFDKKDLKVILKV